MLAALLVLGACASAPDAPSEPPSMVASDNVPAPERARLYADCLAQSTAENTYFGEPRSQGLVRFNCDGTPAERFFDGLSAYSASIGAEYTEGSRTWRFTQPIERNPVGLDYCWREQPATGDATYACTIVLAVGRYLHAD